MFVIYHDHQHHAILNSSKTAEFIMYWFGIYILAPTSIWKRSHDFHHKHNSKLHVSDVGSFPTITKEEYEALSSSDKFKYLAARHPINILVGYITIFMFSFCVNSIVKSPKKHWDCGYALIIHFAFGAFLVVNGGVVALLLTLVLPHLIACMLGCYLFYVQHNFPGASFKLRENWSYDFAATHSSSFFKMNPVMNWFTGNIGFHHVHHLNSRIPFYRLEEAMNAIPELQNVQVTTFSPRCVYSALRLKVWDPESDQLIPV
jgi:omega-6 fatty acid desaturase (delta-12 desaturase)